MPQSASIIRLKPGRQKPIRQGHPWVFSGAIEEWEGPREIGAVAEVVTHEGHWVARGLLHPDAALAVRLYTWRQDEGLDEALFADRVRRAVALRRAVVHRDHPENRTDAYRVIFSESDGISGLIADRYAGLLAVRVNAHALVPHLESLLRILRAETGLDALLVSTDEDAVEREGIDPGALAGMSNSIEGPVLIHENGLRFRVDACAGQKTGFFLDQRENRRAVAAYARGRTLLSAYCYTGAFEVYAAAAGAAHITGIDTSATALAQADAHFSLNGLSSPREYVRGNVTQVLRTFRDSGRSFGLIVLDPPRFVANRAQMEKGLRAYKDINLWALKLLEPGGILATFSCSGLVAADDFLECLRWAAQDAGRAIRIMEVRGQPADHPVLPGFPESSYLKGFLCWAD